LAATADVGNERTWVEEALNDPQAFERLYDHYFPKLYAYVCYRVGSVHESEDLVADTFLRAVEALDRFEWRHEHSFSAWLFRIAHNVVTDHLRRDRRAAQPQSLDDLPDIQDHELLPEDTVLRKERFAQLRQLIATLPPRRQEIITLRFFGGLQNFEVALILDLDERTVASNLCRGLRDLHTRLQSSISDDENVGETDG
jgi:RNA polymerase sigma factor (sigma-70 family)